MPFVHSRRGAAQQLRSLALALGVAVLTTMPGAAVFGECPPAGQEWIRGLVGEWEVFIAGGARVGSISIEEISEPCAYHEVVREGERAPDTTSHIWDETKNRWWQGSHFRRIDFDFEVRGTFAGGALAYADREAVLSHDTSTNDDDDCCFYMRRGTLRGIGTATLRQEREVSLDEGKSWTKLAPFEYRRESPAAR